MPKPTVLVVDTVEARRKELARGLAGFAYEVVVASSAAEGSRFAGGLNPDVIVSEAGLELAPAPGATAVLLLNEEAEEEIGDSVIAIVTAGLAPEELLRKVRTVLVGRELGLSTDPNAQGLRGELHELPLLELLPILQRALLTARIEVGGGELTIEDGEVVAARAGTVSGTKAFARLVRIAGGSFRVTLDPGATHREIYKDLLSLMALAMDDQHQYRESLAQIPSLSSRLRIVIGSAFFATQFSPSQQGLLQAANEGATVWSVLDKEAETDGAILADVVRLRQMGVAEFEEPRPSVRVISDSTCDLPAELTRRHRIHVVPLSVSFGTKVYKDGVDLSAKDFYKTLEKKKANHPKTNPPTQEDFLAQYRLTLARNDVVSVHISERLSETVARARGAAEVGRNELVKQRGDSASALEVVDGKQVSTGLALLVLFAARMAERGLRAREIKERVEAMRQRLHLLFVADTLEYLARGGRIGKAQAWLGEMLGIRPILGVSDGEVIPVDRVRGRNAAHRRLVELLRERVEPAKPVVVGIGHSSAPVLAVRLRSLLQEALKVSEILETEIGPVVGTHVGPGCVGAAVFQPTEEEGALIAPVTDSW